MTDDKKNIAEQEQGAASTDGKEDAQNSLYGREITAFDPGLAPRGSYPTGLSGTRANLDQPASLDKPASLDFDGISPTLSSKESVSENAQHDVQNVQNIQNAQENRQEGQVFVPENTHDNIQENKREHMGEYGQEPMTFAGRDGTAPLNVHTAPLQPNAETESSAHGVAQGAVYGDTPHGVAHLEHTAHSEHHPHSEEAQYYQAAPAQEDNSHMQDAQERSEQAATQEVIELSTASKIFEHMARFAPLYLLFIFVFHTAVSVLFPSTYFPSELQHLQLFETMKQSKQWLLPPVTDSLGIAYPGYYWLMTLVDLIPMPETLFLPVLSAITAIIAIYSVYIMGACLNLKNNGAFASVLVLVSCPLFVIFLHMAQPEILTMSFFCLALGLLYRGWTRESAPFAFIFGFVFLALAVLSGGFLPLWVSLAVSIVLIFWRLDIHRAHKLDAVVGFGFLVLCFAAWLVLVILLSQHANVLDSIMKAAIVPFMPPYWPLPMPWWTLAIVVCGLFPWFIAPLFSPWFTILKNTLSNLKASRTTNSGPTWLYLTAIAGLIILVLQKNDAPLAALPLLPVFGLILGKTICNFGPRGSSFFFLIFALCLLVGGIAATVVSIPATAVHWTPYVSAQVADALKNMYGLPIISALLIIASLVLIRFTKRTQPHGALLVVAFFSLLVVQPVVLFVAPSLVGHYTKYHYKGNGLVTVPDAFGMPKAILPTAATKETEQGKQATPAINPVPVTVPSNAPNTPPSVSPSVPTVEQNPQTPSGTQTNTPPAEQNPAPNMDEAPPIAVPMQE